MRSLRSFALALALAFLILPAAPLGGIVPLPMVGGEAMSAEVELYAPDPECVVVDGERVGGCFNSSGAREPSCRETMFGIMVGTSLIGGAAYFVGRVAMAAAGYGFAFGCG